MNVTAYNTSLKYDELIHVNREHNFWSKQYPYSCFTTHFYSNDIMLWINSEFGTPGIRWKYWIKYEQLNLGAGDGCAYQSLPIMGFKTEKDLIWFLINRPDN